MQKTTSSTSLDWLSLNCRRLNTFNPQNSTKYKWLLEPYHSNLFLTIYTIHFSGEEVATLSYNVRNKIINPETVILKLHNKILYTHFLPDFIPMLLHDLCLTFHSISRLDVCRDFNHLHNNRTPSKFIHNVLNGSILTKFSKTITSAGKSNQTNGSTYLRFGKGSSDVIYYIYNKTLEMADNSHKPWIIDKWLNCAIDLSKDVWRFEFRIQHIEHSIVNYSTGECISVKSLEILQQSNIEELFNSLLNAKATFYKSSSLSRKYRSKVIKILDNHNSEYSFISNCEHLESNLSDRIFAKKLYIHYNLLREQRSSYTLPAIETYNNFIEQKSLSTWAICHGYIAEME